MLQSTRKHEAGCAGANLNLPPECDAELGPPRGQNPPGPASSRRPRPEWLLGRPWLGCPGDSARPGLPGHACHRGTITVCSAHRRPCLADGGPGRGTRPLTPPPPSEGPAQRGRRWVSGGAGGACAGGRRRGARGPAGPAPRLTPGALRPRRGHGEKPLARGLHRRERLEGDRAGAPPGGPSDHGPPPGSWAGPAGVCSSARPWGAESPPVWDTASSRCGPPGAGHRPERLAPR